MPQVFLFWRPLNKFEFDVITITILYFNELATSTLLALYAM